MAREGISFDNAREIRIASDIANSLTSPGLIALREIAIIVQLREQVRLMRALRSAPWPQGYQTGTYRKLPGYETQGCHNLHYDVSRAVPE